MHIASGRSIEETIAARATAAYDPRFGAGFVNAGQFSEAVYRSLGDAR